MKWKRKDCLSYGLAAILLIGAFGIIGWQGIQYLTEENSAQTMQRIILNTTAYSDQIVELSTSATGMTGILQTNGTSECTQNSSKTTSVTAAATVRKQAAEHVQQETVTFPLELNTATAQQLDQLPGIGTVLAGRIVDYRTQIGGFLYREQLLEVNGIGDAIFREIYDLVYLTDEQIPMSAEEVSPEVPDAQNDNFLSEPETIQSSSPPQETSSDLESAESGVSVTEPIVVDLNAADFAQLMQIPYMNEELANEILAFREEYAYFSSIYELLYLEHMKESLFMEMIPYVCVETSES